MTVRTRFAPSPTGYLHIGGARTALYSYLYAKHYGGQFILRIEDTDRERSTDEAIQAILEGMQWLGLEYDEGPFYQTHHIARYQEVLQQLLDTGHAYRCYCSKERLEKMREEQMANKQKPRYDGYCREREQNATEPYVIRFKNPHQGEVVIDDLVLGKIVIDNAELDDLILARSDGMPTYNFTVVVDDWDMKITHVIRGNDHVNNTPRQVNLFLALGATPPQYAHIPMILDEHGKKLSKRTGAASVMEYREQGILPHALLNYLVRLGWSHGDQELFSMDELIQSFNGHSLSKSGAAMNPQKLLWLNQHYLQNSALNELVPEFNWQLSRLGINTEASTVETSAIIALQRERCKTLQEMAQKSLFFYTEVSSYDEKAVASHMDAEALRRLAGFKGVLEQVSPWQADTIHTALQQFCEQEGCKMGQVAQPLRIALTGNSLSPPIDQTLYLLGKELVQKRLQRFLEMQG
ncbi:MAG: glutamyl- and glutaminyl-tRNA synthetase [Gammaproteobacteria bacterium]|jgi:glutamyl-tRNA synthetase|nr:glutamyl- and glutaminyl-tRNA synthetase [Gammaproteobacteria bacterium]